MNEEQVSEFLRDQNTRHFGEDLQYVSVRWDGDWDSFVEVLSTNEHKARPALFTVDKLKVLRDGLNTLIDEIEAAEAKDTEEQDSPDCQQEGVNEMIQIGDTHVDFLKKAIIATDGSDPYSVGVRNGLRVALADLTGEDPGIEKCCAVVSKDSCVKSLGNTDVNGASKNVSDLVVFGNGDMFKLLCKASSQNEGWMKSTKACPVSGGCIVQVTTQQRNPDGSYAVAEALTFVPGVEVREDKNEEGKVIGRRLL